jgi:hypothetical protein
MTGCRFVPASLRKARVAAPLACAAVFAGSLMFAPPVVSAPLAMLVTVDSFDGRSAGEAALSENGGAASAAARALPEPLTLSLIGLAAVVLVARQVRRLRRPRTVRLH